MLVHTLLYKVLNFSSRNFNQFKMVQKIKSIGQKRIATIMTILIVLASQFSFSQDPGGGPDGPPPAVPFDDYLNIILLVVGIVLTILVLKTRNLVKNIKG